MPYSDLAVAATCHEERGRILERRLEHSRALHEQAIERALRENHDRLWMRLLDRIRPEHSLTPYPCRLPSGDQGRTEIRFLGGEWTAVCVPEPQRRVRAG
jgi:hypothetical protein